MPGLAAGSNIFEYISLPDQKFELHYLEWIEPASEKEGLSVYAFKYKELIKHDRPILVGVSFGGILIQEIANILEVSKLVIISSIKSGDEMPRRLKFLKKSGRSLRVQHNKLMKMLIKLLQNNFLVFQLLKTW